MSVRWLCEHRRVLAAGTVLLLVAGVVLATVGGGSSAAQRTGPPAPTVALAAARRQLAVEQTEVRQLRTLTSRQSVEISSLRAEVRAVRGRRARHNHKK